MRKTYSDVKLSSLNRKITANKSKHLLVENELKKLKTLDSSYFRGKSHFEEDDVQSCLIFQPIKIYFKLNGKYISSWKSKVLYKETITPYGTSDNSLTKLTDYYGRKVRVKFNKGCLKQPSKITYDYGSRVNIYIFMSLVLLVLIVVILH